jgi:hypothetical protein
LGAIRVAVERLQQVLERTDSAKSHSKAEIPLKEAKSLDRVISYFAPKHGGDVHELRKLVAVIQSVLRVRGMLLMSLLKGPARPVVLLGFPRKARQLYGSTCLTLLVATIAIRPFNSERSSLCVNTSLVALTREYPSHSSWATATPHFTTR